MAKQQLHEDVVVQLFRSVLPFATLWSAAPQASCPSLSPRICSNSCTLSQWCHPTISSSSRPLLYLPSFSSIIKVFSIESTLHIRWTKCWSFSFSPSNEYSELISFKTDWFHILAIQGMLKSLFQCHWLKTSILQHSAFFMVQISHPYVINGKTIDLTRWTFVGKAMAVLFILFYFCFFFNFFHLFLLVGD